MGLLLLILFFGMVFALVTANIAGEKGYDKGTAGLLGFFFGLIPLIVYAMRGPKQNYCPKCGLPHIFYVDKCRQCGTGIPDAEPRSSP